LIKAIFTKKQVELIDKWLALTKVKNYVAAKKVYKEFKSIMALLEHADSQEI